jgi:hypothetical protein
VLSLRLSRACLGKIIIITPTTWPGGGRFSYLIKRREVPDITGIIGALHGERPRVLVPAGKKRHLLQRCVVLVPSLSWQNDDRFLVKPGSRRKGVFHTCCR